jgi:hypothetical protein
MRSLITLVSDPSGAGKTTWTQQQINSVAESSVYLNLGSGTTPIDATYLAAEVSGLTVLLDEQLADFLAHPITGCSIYLELGFQIDLVSLVLPDKMANCRRVAVLPPGTRQTEWHGWADLTVTGAEIGVELSQPHL